MQLHAIFKVLFPPASMAGVIKPPRPALSLQFLYIYSCSPFSPIFSREIQCLLKAGSYFVCMSFEKEPWSIFLFFSFCMNCDTLGLCNFETYLNHRKKPNQSWHFKQLCHFLICLYSMVQKIFVLLIQIHMKKNIWSYFFF